MRFYARFVVVGLLCGRRQEALQLLQELQVGVGVGEGEVERGGEGEAEGEGEGDGEREGGTEGEGGIAVHGVITSPKEGGCVGR